MPPWPNGLPDATVTADGSAVLPSALADAVWRRLAMADTFSARCQAHLDALGQLQRARQDEMVALAIDKWAREHAPDPVPWWRQYIIPAIATVAVIAFGAGTYAGSRI